MRSPNNILNRILSDMKALRCAIDDIIACNPCGGGGGTIVGLLDIFEGANISIDKTDPLRPIISSTGGTGSNDYVINGAFNISNGDVTLTRLSGGIVDYNLDGRYSLLGHTHVIGDITDFTDNSTNWNTAYNNSITGITVGGTSTKTITLTRQTGPSLQASFSDIGVNTYAALTDRITVDLPNINTPLSNALAAKENSLGNPTTNGYILASTAAGVRSWVAQATGGGGIPEAPIDGQCYSRKDASWQVCTSGTGTIQKYSETFGDNVNKNYIITHNFNVTDLHTLRVIDLATGEKVYPTEFEIDNNTVRLEFESIVTTNKYRVTISAEGVGVITSKYVQLFGDNSNTIFTINHNLNSEDIVSVRITDVLTGEKSYPTEIKIDKDNISLEYSTAPTTNQYKVVITS